jgi:hypothetical protein
MAGVAGRGRLKVLGRATRRTNEYHLTPRAWRGWTRRDLSRRPNFAAFCAAIAETRPARQSRRSFVQSPKWLTGLRPSHATSSQARVPERRYGGNEAFAPRTFGPGRSRLEPVYLIPGRVGSQRAELRQRFHDDSTSGLGCFKFRTAVFAERPWPGA